MLEFTVYFPYMKYTNFNTNFILILELRYRQKTFQFQEIHTYDYNEIAELRKTRVAKKRNRAILREMTFANDCVNCCFFAQNWCATKEKFCVSFRKNCAKVLRMETLVQIPIFLESEVLKLWYFKLSSFDLPEFVVWISKVGYGVAKI